MLKAGKEKADAEDRFILVDDFDWVVWNHQRRIFRVLLSIVNDEDAAETLTQECFLRAFKKRDSFRGDSSLVTWLIHIAVNLAHDYVRNRRRAFWHKLVHMDRVDQMPIRETRRSPEQTVLDKEIMDKVQNAVDRLPVRQKTVFVLRFVEEMSLDEIADATGMRTGTVKTHLHRAVRTVRDTCGR